MQFVSLAKEGWSIKLLKIYSEKIFKYKVIFSRAKVLLEFRTIILIVPLLPLNVIKELYLSLFSNFFREISITISALVFQ